VFRPITVHSQSVQGYLDAWRDRMSQILARRRYGAEGGGRTEINGYTRAAVRLVGGHRVDDEVGAHLARVVGQDGHAGLDARPYHQSLQAELARRH
jgi:hypothetical protein